MSRQVSLFQFNSIYSRDTYLLYPVTVYSFFVLKKSILVQVTFNSKLYVRKFGFFHPSYLK